MLNRLRELANQGLKEKAITAQLQEEFDGVPETVGETRQELQLLRTGPKAGQWNRAMEARVKEYYNQGMDVNDIMNELFDEFAKPQSGYWQEVYRKIQALKMKGEIH